MPWTPRQVSCRTSIRSSAAAAEARSLIKAHTFTNDIPQAGDETVHINLWVLGGLPLGDLKEAEIVIRKFQFVPLRKRLQSDRLKPRRLVQRGRGASRIK